MVRTRNTANRKVAGEKAVRKVGPTPSSSNSNGTDSKNKYGGGNPVCPRETPEWQKPITSFFPLVTKPSTCTSLEGASASGSATATDVGACGSGTLTGSIDGASGILRGPDSSKPVGAFSALFVPEASGDTHRPSFKDKAGQEQAASATTNKRESDEEISTELGSVSD